MKIPITVILFINLVIFSSCGLLWEDKKPHVPLPPSPIIGNWQLNYADTVYVFYDTTINKDTSRSGYYTANKTINITFNKNDSFTGIDYHQSPAIDFSGTFFTAYTSGGSYGSMNIINGDSVSTVQLFMPSGNNFFFTSDTSLSTPFCHIIVSKNFDRQ
jgi:hypothetical protein